MIADLLVDYFKITNEVKITRFIILIWLDFELET